MDNHDQIEEIMRAVELSLYSAAQSILDNNYGKALYSVDRAEIELMRIRNLLVSIIHQSEGDN